MSLAGYDNYKESGLQWLGNIPDHWKVTRLTTVCRFQSGKAHEPFIDHDGDFICVNSRFVSTEGEAQKFCTENLSPTQRDDILMVMSDLPNGRALAKAFFVDDDKPYAVNQRVCIITAHEADAKFIYYQLDRNPLFLRHDDGVNQTHLSNATFTKFPTLVPPLNEQKAISSFLDVETSKIDDLASEQRRLIALLKETRQAVISHAVTKGLNPNAPMKPSGVEWFGDIPESWFVTRFKRVAETSYGAGGELDRTLTEGTRILSLPNVDIEGKLILDDVPFRVLDDNERKEVLLKQGDLLFNWRNGSASHLAKTAFFDLEGDYTHVSFLLRLRFDPERQSSRFFRHFINALRSTKFFSSAKAGVNNTFNQSELENLLVVVPPLHEQIAIADHMDELLQQSNTLHAEAERAIELLQERRTALISAAVTGKIDVRKFTAQGAK